MPPGETLFITYRLYGTIPRSILLQIQSEHELFLAKQADQKPNEDFVTLKKQWEGRYFLAIDSFLDTQSGEEWLGDSRVAEIVKESIHFRDEHQFELHAYCIMPNHVHLLVTSNRIDKPFYQVLGSLKANSAKKANILLERVGKPFWQPERYDHAVRNGKSFERIISYILYNPVKAGLTSDWQKWPHTYCKYD